MSSNHMSAKKRATSVTKLLLKLDETRKDRAEDGYIRNWLGQYWRKSFVEDLVAKYRELIDSLNDARDKSAMYVSLIGALRNAMMLDEASEVGEQCIGLFGQEVPPMVLRLLAEVEARRGQMDRARARAHELNSRPGGRLFRISDEELAAIRAQATNQA
jgi:hypothetical protein